MPKQYFICTFFMSNISVVQPFWSCPPTAHLPVSSLSCYYSCISSSDQHHTTNCPDHCLKDHDVLLPSCVMPLSYPSPHFQPCSARYKVFAFTFKSSHGLSPLHLVSFSCLSCFGLSAVLGGKQQSCCLCQTFLSCSALSCCQRKP